VDDQRDPDHIFVVLPTGAGHARVITSGSPNPGVSMVEGGGTAQTAGTLRLGLLLAAAGGFLDAFTYVGHGGVFANAQTGNVVLLGVFAAKGDWAAALRHLPPLLAFFLGVFTAETMRHPRLEALLRRPFRAALVAEIVVLAVIGALPDSFADTAIVLLVAFTAALQNATFSTVHGWSVNTTITTGNLRTASRALYRALFRHEPRAGEQAGVFGGICLAFLIGAGLGALVTAHIRNHAAWVAAGALVLALLMFVIDEHRPVRSVPSGPE
jgi:uncharacterized membrane protein YoaK (UPF0700 family)